MFSCRLIFRELFSQFSYFPLFFARCPPQSLTYSRVHKHTPWEGFRRREKRQLNDNQIKIGAIAVWIVVAAYLPSWYRDGFFLSKLDSNNKCVCCGVCTKARARLLHFFTTSVNSVNVFRWNNFLCVQFSVLKRNSEISLDNTRENSTHSHKHFWYLANADKYVCSIRVMRLIFHSLRSHTIIISQQQQQKVTL